jgi:hypothetical protein
MSDRTLRLTSPHMTGADVTGFQRDLNTRLDAWHVPHQVDVDGDYGLDTRDTAKSVLYGLGVDASASSFDGVSPTDRSKVRHGFDALTPDEQQLNKQRAEWRKRYAERFGGGAVGVALKYARDHIGVTEDPPGSNRGPQIDVWERACRVLGAPWCGCFVNACLHEAGFPNTSWLRFCPSIEGNARGGGFGWTWHQSGDARPGDLALYGTSIASHVGIVEETADGVDTSTIEGNTSTGPGGSQSNGGIVARRHRHTDGSLNGFPIRGYARPPWDGVA